MIGEDVRKNLGSVIMNILTELKNELGYANVTNQYIELAARTFQLDHGNDNLQEQAGMVGLLIATLPEDYLKRIANGYIIGVHSCVEHFLVQYRFLPGSPARGQNYSAEDDDNRLKWILNICYGNRIPHDVKQLYFICNYYTTVEYKKILFYDSLTFYNANAKNIKEMFFG